MLLSATVLLATVLAFCADIISVLLVLVARLETLCIRSVLTARPVLAPLLSCGGIERIRVDGADATFCSNISLSVSWEALIAAGLKLT